MKHTFTMGEAGEVLVVGCFDLREQVWDNIEKAHDFEYGFSM